MNYQIIIAMSLLTLGIELFKFVSFKIWQYRVEKENQKILKTFTENLKSKEKEIVN